MSSFLYEPACKYETKFSKFIFFHFLKYSCSFFSFCLIKYQASEQGERRRLNKQQESDDNCTEIANHVYGDILTENPAVAQSAFGSHRVITDRWKGMSPEQLADIKRQQDLQRKEKQVRPLPLPQQCLRNAASSNLVFLMLVYFRALFLKDLQELRIRYIYSLTICRLKNIQTFVIQTAGPSFQK